MTFNKELYDQIQLVLSGHHTTDALNVLVECLAVTLAYAAPDQESVEEVIATFPEHIAQRVEANWENARAARARSTQREPAPRNN